MTDNRYLNRIRLEKQAFEPISAGAAALLHGAGVHVMQNLAMKGALKSKALGSHLAKGFSEGIANVHDVGLKAKAKRALIGATLPEVNAMYTTAHSAGKALSPHLSLMSPKQRAGLKMISSGNIEGAVKRGFHKDPTIVAAHSEAKRHFPGLPDIPQDEAGAKALAEKVRGKSNSAILSSVIPKMAKGDPLLKGKFKPGAAPSGKAGVLGGMALAPVDPVTSGINTFKNLIDTNAIKNSRLGSALHHKLETIAIKDPFHKGLASPNSRFSGIKDRIYESVVNPLPVEMKRMGSSVGRIINKD